MQVLASHKSTEPVTAQERTALKSVVLSLAWIARAARPDISFRVNVLQTHVATATVSTLHECNRVLDLAMKDANRGLTFKSGLWTGGRTICTFADASFTAQTGSKSQQGRIYYLPDHATVHEGSAVQPLHVLNWSSIAQSNVSAALRSRQKHIPCKPLWRPETESA